MTEGVQPCIPALVMFGPMLIGPIQAVARLAILLLFITTSARADKEAPNRAHVRASEWGHFYAKSVPTSTYGAAGFTQIYRVVGSGPDQPLHRYEWYSTDVLVDGLLGSSDVYVVQFGPWPRGSRARPDHLAIAFFKNGKLLKSHSTLDIAGAPERVSVSNSHYQVLGARRRFRWSFGSQRVVDVEDMSGRTLTFNADTGLLLAPGEEKLMRRLEEARSVLQGLRWRWFEENQSTHSNAAKHLITESELRTLPGSQFPNLPSGYRYIPGTAFDPVVLKN